MLPQNLPEPLAKEEQLALWRRAARGDASARRSLVSTNLRLVVSRAARFARNGAGVASDINDLVSEGTIGLDRAIDKFDPAIREDFAGYALFWIDWFIRDRCRKDRQIVNCPDAPSAYTAYRRAVERGLDHEAAVSSVVAALRFKRATTERILNMALGTNLSLDMPVVGSDFDGPMVEHVTLDDGEGDAELLERASEIRWVRRAAARVRDAMCARHRDIFDRCVIGEEPQAEVAASLGVTRQRVGQIVEEIRERLRGALADATARPARGQRSR